jgi:acyl-CoA oxidase
VPYIADAYAQLFGYYRVKWLAQENVRRINEKQDFSLMGDLHALLSCQKAVYTWNTYFGLEKIR